MAELSNVWKTPPTQTKSWQVSKWVWLLCFCCHYSRTHWILYFTQIFNHSRSHFTNYLLFFCFLFKLELTVIFTLRTRCFLMNCGLSLERCCTDVVLSHTQTFSQPTGTWYLGNHSAPLTQSCFIHTWAQSNTTQVCTAGSSSSTSNLYTPELLSLQICSDDSWIKLWPDYGARWELKEPLNGMETAANTGGEVKSSLSQ